MFRLKFALAFVVLLSLQVGFVYLMFQAHIEPTVLEDTDIALQRSASMVEKSHRMDQYSLAEKARFVAARPTIRRAMIAEYQGDAEYERHVEIHKHLETEQLRFEQQSRRSANKRNLELELLHRRPVDQELFMALDVTGRGVATLGPDLAHWMGDKVGHDYPVVLEAMEQNRILLDVWSWSFQSNEDGQLYSVAIAPIRHPEKDESIGVIVLGNLMSDGVAKRSQALISDGYGVDGDGALSDRAQVQSPQVAFFHGDRIHSSTLRTSKQNELRQALFEEHQVLSTAAQTPLKVLDLELGEETYRGMVRFFSGKSDGDAPAGVILLTNREAAIAPIARAKTNIFFVTGLLLLLGLGTLATLFHLFLRPIEKIEDGIQAIISGDKDHVFEQAGSHDIANGLVHQLNLMSAYLQGKPMPDDDDYVGGWDDLSGGSTESSSGDKPAVAGVPMNLGARKPKATDEKKNDPALEEEA